MDIDSPAQADLWAGCWCASAQQMTLREKPDEIPDSVKAMYLAVDIPAIADITPQFAQAKQRYYAEHDPRALDLSRRIFPEITEIQSCFSFYERECRNA